MRLNHTSFTVNSNHADCLHLLNIKNTKKYICTKKGIPRTYMWIYHIDCGPQLIFYSVFYFMCKVDRSTEITNYPGHVKKTLINREFLHSQAVGFTNIFECSWAGLVKFKIRSINFQIGALLQGKWQHIHYR